MLASCCWLVIPGRSAGPNPESRDSGFAARAAPRNASKTKPERAPGRVGGIGPLPGEAAVLFGGAAEVTIGRGAAVDRAVQLQRAADVGRRQAEQLGQNLLEL